MKQTLVIFLAITSLVLFETCRKSENIDKPAIALVLKTLNNPFFIDMQKGADSAAKELGIDLIVQAAEREVDVEKQMQIIENLIQRKVSAICITPSGSKEIVPAIIKANEAKIPVLIIDTRVDKRSLTESGGHVVTFIGSDNKDGGRIAGEYIADRLGGKGNVAILEGIPGHETGDARLSGFHEALEKYKGIKIVASQTANWERDQGFNVFQNILQAHPEVQAVFACNDMMALGAVEAISAAQKKNKIVVVGFDAISDSRVAILMDEMHGSIAQHPEEMGKLAIEYAYKAIKGENVPAEMPVKIELITKERLIKK
ncbi:MAG: substrate-binding domain-containing protein [bacterium]